MARLLCILSLLVKLPSAFQHARGQVFASKAASSCISTSTGSRTLVVQSFKEKTDQELFVEANAPILVTFISTLILILTYRSQAQGETLSNLSHEVGLLVNKVDLLANEVDLMANKVDHLASKVDIFLTGLSAVGLIAVPITGIIVARTQFEIKKKEY